MKTFFNDDEREELRKKYLDIGENTLSVFKLDKRLYSQLIAQFGEEFSHGIDYLDISLGNSDEDDKSLLGQSENRKKIIDFTKRWMSFPMIDFSSAAGYLYHELIKPQGDRGIDDTLQHRLDEALEKVVLMEKFVEVSDHFPFMYMPQQLSSLLTLEKKQISSIRPQYDFLMGISNDDLANGNLDFKRLKDISRLYTPFTPTLLTLELMEKMSLPEGKRFFPIVNSNFFGLNNYDFKGIIEVIPKSTYEMMTSVDPRAYHFGREGIDIKNWLTCVLMSDKGGSGKATNSFLSLLKEGKFIDFKLEMAGSMLRNVGYTLNEKKLMDPDPRLIIDLVNHSREGIAKIVAEKFDDNYMELSSSDINNITMDLTRPGFYISFRHMRLEQEFIHEDSVKKGQNPLLLMIDPLQSSSVATPIVYTYIASIESDLGTILREAPRRMLSGGKFFHQNKDFFGRLKAGQVTLDEESYNMVKKIRENIQEPGFKEYIDTFITGVDSGNREMINGDPSDGILHYLSRRFPSKIILQEVHGTKGENIALGYAMNNCLDIVQIMRHLMNPDARIYCMWSDGLKVGMSYDINMRSHGTEKKDPLIDSIELSDAFYKKMKNVYEQSDGNPVSPSLLVDMLVHGYLDARLMMSEKGIYVLPESNNFHVRSAVEKFIEQRHGQKVMSYDGPRVTTDTIFRRTPYWVDKNILSKENAFTVLIDKNGNGNLSDSRLMQQAIEELKPLGITPESVEHIENVYRNMVNIGK